MRSSQSFGLDLNKTSSRPLIGQAAVGCGLHRSVSQALRSNFRARKKQVQECLCRVVCDSTNGQWSAPLFLLFRPGRCLYLSEVSSAMPGTKPVGTCALFYFAGRSHYFLPKALSPAPGEFVVYLRFWVVLVL